MSAKAGSVRNRALAIVSIGLLGLVVFLVLQTVINNVVAISVAVGGLAILAWGAWWSITEQWPRRAIGLLGVATGVALVFLAFRAAEPEASYPWIRLVAAVCLAAGSATCARLAIVARLHQLDLARSFPRLRPSHPVLICNPWSGGGKVERFDLVNRARALGVEVIMLERGLDLEKLARDAVARGADCLGMAGGDGSQALVAGIAVEHGLPFVCISAGTRNHFALDLGLDRDDPSKGLVAFSDGVIRKVDYARVGSRLFVNNVSLGVYAEIVDQDGYRGAKLATTTEILSELLGRTAEVFDLQFTPPEGREVDGALLILVSNNPYILGPKLDVSQRRSLTTGKLGVLAISARTGMHAAALMTRTALGRTGTGPNIQQFTTESLQVRSRSGSANAGIDGEAVRVDTPLEFRIQPKGLTILVPPDNPVVTAAKHYRNFGVAGLWDIARGRTPEELTRIS